MGSEEIVEKVADMLRDHELVISELYGAFAEKIPEDRELWSVMKTEEEGHARFVEKLKERVRSGDVRFTLGRLHVPTLEKSTDSVRAQVDMVRSSEVTRAAALANALAIENGLLDHGFYNVIGDGTALSRNLKKAMSRSIESHVARLYNMYARVCEETESPCTRMIGRSPKW